VRLLTLNPSEPSQAVHLDTEMSAAEVAALPTADEQTFDARHLRVYLTGIRVAQDEHAEHATQGEDAVFNIEVTFEHAKMRRVTLIAQRPGDAQRWEDWSADQEAARKTFHEEWATRTLGAAFEPLRIEVDGTWISTEWPEPAPKQATMPWGQLRSVYDQHAATATLIMLIGFVGG
jgi:hypothetical protein